MENQLPFQYKMIEIDQMQAELKKYLKLFKNTQGNVESEYSQTQRFQNESFNNCLLIGNERQLSRNSTHQNIQLGKYNNKIKRSSQDFQNGQQITQVNQKSNPNIKSQTQKSINSNKVVSLVPATEQPLYLDKKPRSISQQTISEKSIKAPYINSSISQDQNINPFNTTRTQKTISLHNEFGTTYHIPTSLTSRNEYNQENISPFPNAQLQNFPFQRNVKPKSFTSSKTNILSQTNITSKTNIESQRDISQQMNSTSQKVNTSKVTKTSKKNNPLQVITQAHDFHQENQQAFLTQRSGNFKKVPSIPKFGHHLPLKKEKSPNQSSKNQINQQNQNLTQYTKNRFGKNKVNKTYSKEISKDNSHYSQGSIVIDRLQSPKENSLQNQRQSHLVQSNRNSQLVNNPQLVNTFSFEWKNKSQPQFQIPKSNIKSQLNINLFDNKYTPYGAGILDQQEKKFSINSSLQQEKLKNADVHIRSNSQQEKASSLTNKINLDAYNKLRNFGEVTQNTTNQKKMKEIETRSEQTFSIFSPSLLDVYSPSEGQKLNRIETIYLNSEQSKVSIPSIKSNDKIEINDKIKENSQNQQQNSTQYNESQKHNFVDQNFNLETIESANYNPPQKNKQYFQSIQIQQVQQSQLQQGENHLSTQYDNFITNKKLHNYMPQFQTNQEVNEKMFTFESPHKVIQDNHQSRLFSTDGKVVFQDGKSPCQNTPTKNQVQTSQRNIPTYPDQIKNNFDCFALTYQTDKKQVDQQNSHQRSSQDYQSPFENKFSQQPPDGGVSPIITKNKFLIQNNSDNKNNVIGQAYSYNGSDEKQNSQRKDIFDSGQNSFLFGDPIQESLRNVEKSDSKYNDFQQQDPIFKDLKTLENNISFKVISNTNHSFSNSSQTIQSNRQSEHIFNLHEYEKILENKQTALPVLQENFLKTNENNLIKNNNTSLKVYEQSEKNQTSIVLQQFQNSKSLETNDILFNISEKLQRLHTPRQQESLKSTFNQNTSSQKLAQSNIFGDKVALCNLRDQCLQKNVNFLQKTNDINSTYSSLKNPVISNNDTLGTKSDLSSLPIAQNSNTSHQDIFSKVNRDQENQIQNKQLTSIFSQSHHQTLSQLSSLTYGNEQNYQQNYYPSQSCIQKYSQLQNYQSSIIQSQSNTQNNIQQESIIQPYLNDTKSTQGSLIEQKNHNNSLTDQLCQNEKTESTNKKHTYDFEMNSKINSLKPLLFTSIQSPPIPPQESSPIYYSSQFNSDNLNSNSNYNLNSSKTQFEKPPNITITNPVTSQTQISQIQSPTDQKIIQKYTFPAFKFDIQQILDKYIPNYAPTLQTQCSTGLNQPLMHIEHTAYSQINDDYFVQLNRNNNQEIDQNNKQNNQNNSSSLSIYSNKISKEQDSIKKDQNQLKFYSFQDNDSSASSVNLTTLNNNKQLFSPNCYLNTDKIKEETEENDINRQDSKSIKQDSYTLSQFNQDSCLNNILYRDSFGAPSLSNDQKNELIKKQYSISTHEASNKSNTKYYYNGSFSELPTDLEQPNNLKKSIYATVMQSRQSDRENQESQNCNNISLSQQPTMKSSFNQSQKDNYQSGIVLTSKTYLNLPNLKQILSKFTCEQVLEQLFDNFSMSFTSLNKDFFIYKIQCLINQNGTQNESLDLINKELEALYNASDMVLFLYKIFNKEYYLDMNDLSENLLQLCKVSDYDSPIKTLFKKIDTQNSGRIRLQDFQNFAYQFGYDQFQFSQQKQLSKIKFCIQKNILNFINNSLFKQLDKGNKNYITYIDFLVLQFILDQFKSFYFKYFLGFYNSYINIFFNIKQIQEQYDLKFIMKKYKLVKLQ